ncbi:hypothetical protein FJQ98_06715 [Lysinibacillus agricola]|uniref:Uncharacterized protein n=1 Tax=Lysinibacillus agricola TaxID=2590012 RepID=A0ABX7AUU3_9BACI|nr:MULTISPECIES: hypothetical protein [Lysinibacillus]KOS62765.1 hypothetical protein AN161_10625 [Lysinibacillus sp. FJAT-14222]QQP13738.1 hypothetical protein FJQ98_06715 [Lysinibacillus agricola]
MTIYIPDKSIANTNIINIKNDIPSTTGANLEVCPLITEIIATIKPIEAINRIITDMNGSGIFDSKVLKKRRKKSI